MLDLQHQYNNCTTIPHMRVSPTYWSPPSCEGLLYSCCIGVVQESNPIKRRILLQHIFVKVMDRRDLTKSFYTQTLSSYANFLCISDFVSPRFLKSRGAPETVPYKEMN